MVGQSRQVRSVRVDAIQIRGAVALGREDDRRSVGRPRGVVIEAGWGKQWAFVGPVSRRQEQPDLTWLRKDSRDGQLLRLGRLGKRKAREREEKRCAHARPPWRKCRRVDDEYSEGPSP